MDASHFVLECGGKRSATPLLMVITRAHQSKVPSSLTLCRRTPKERKANLPEYAIESSRLDVPQHDRCISTTTRE